MGHYKREMEMNMLKSIRVGFLVLATAALAIASGPAFAHAKLLSEVPASVGAATVPATPVTELRLTFSEELNLAFSKVAIKDAMGMAIDGVTVALDAADAQVLVVTLAAPLAAGEYDVDWTASSADGHKTTGTYKVNISE